MSHLLIVKRLELYMDLALYKINILFKYIIIRLRASEQINSSVWVIFFRERWDPT